MKVDWFTALALRTRLWRARLLAMTTPGGGEAEAGAVRDEAVALGMTKVAAEAGALAR